MKYLLCLMISISSYANLIGEGKLEYGIFGIDLYNVRYYKTTEHQIIELDYLRDIEKKYSIQGWVEGLQLNLGQDYSKYVKQITWLKTNTPDVIEGDILKIKVQGNKVSFEKNGSTISSIEDEVLAKIIHLPWIGEKPVDKELKKKLTGQS